mmetsp:Transcript_29111/g.69894  ORF Transcript_29111/g.69894 Transcript_29111/m.69894 type:complete len:231 (-) Transcript_29111:3218-3910(-)
MLGIHLLSLVATEGASQMGDSAISLIGLNLITVQELSSLVPSSEVQHHVTCLDSSGLPHNSLLNERTEGDEACTKPNHDQRSLGVFRKVHHRRVDPHWHQGRILHICEGRFRVVLKLHCVPPLHSRRLISKEPSGLPTTHLALGVLPVFLNNAQMNVIRVHFAGRADGIQSRLNRWHVVQQILNRNTSRWEQLHNISVGHSVLDQRPHLALAFLGDEEFKSLPLLRFLCQ